ncbi:MAG: YggS family pyridoxal phosphate-dependent enzyme [Oscillospiraceae bacterium]|nr:YggS family pyridoxal phosphate-dependent enzyme [Oscillospiraceae bacterium]
MTEKSFLEQRQADICYNLDVINEKIANAAIKSGRNPEDIRLMAVTKTVDPMYINFAIDHGVNLIGENRVQELLRKKDELHLDGVEKHLIGHLQTNKAGQIVGVADMIQSVDSVKIAKEIAKQSVKKGIETDVLLEINIGAEENKTGFEVGEFRESVYEIAEIGGIHVKGLMSVPPICENDTILCKFFENIYNIYVDIKGKKIDNISMQILSMGMSSDYEKAILCGSELVRIGSAIFGPRIY